jgi:hypothetical protein
VDATTTDPSTTTSSGQTTPSVEVIDFCAAGSLCAAFNPESVISDAIYCPAVTGNTPAGSGVVVPGTTDSTPFQTALDTTTKPIREKWTIVITLVIKLASSDANVNSQVKLFVDLIGTPIPTPQDEEDLCGILKNTLAGLETQIQISMVQCKLNLQTSVKRDVKYVATMSYPGGDNLGGSASTLIASFAAVALGVVAAVF